MPEHRLTQLEVAKRWANFWSSVSAIRVEETVPLDTQVAIVRGVEKAYGKETNGAET